MASKRVNSEEPKSSRRRPPAMTPEAEENQLIALATDLAAQQMRDGTASSQVITHYLKLGSSRERKEQRRLELESQLLEKKIESQVSAQRVEELMSQAINAFRGYAGQAPDEEEVYYE